MRNQAHAGEATGSADRRVGIAGQRKIGFYPAFPGAARNGRGDILGEAEKPVEP